MGEAAGAGHNSGVAADRLKALIARLEGLHEEKQDILEQIKDVKKQAKGEGFDLKTVEAVLRRRRMKPADLAEQEMLLETYEAALGQLATTPLGQAALARAAA